MGTTGRGRRCWIRHDGPGDGRNLLRAGLPVDVWDRTTAVTAQLTGGREVAYASPADSVAHADVGQR